MKVPRFFASSLVAVLLLSGCSGAPDLMQCQAAAELGSEFEAYFQERRGETTSEEELNEQLRTLAAEYAELSVDGDVGVATATLSSDLLDLYKYRQDVAERGSPDSAEEEHLTSAAVRSFADIQALCQVAGIPRH